MGEQSCAPCPVSAGGEPWGAHVGQHSSSCHGCVLSPVPICSAFSLRWEWLMSKLQRTILKIAPSVHMGSYCTGPACSGSGHCRLEGSSPPQQGKGSQFIGQGMSLHTSKSAISALPLTLCFALPNRTTKPFALWGVEAMGKNAITFINKKKPTCLAASTGWQVLEKLFLKVPDLVL